MAGDDAADRGGAARRSRADGCGRSIPCAIAAAVGVPGAGTACSVAAERSAFDLGRGERRYVDVARFVASHTDPDAVILSVQHSGSLRLYADRLTLRYDALDPLWLDRVVAYLQSIGRRPYYVLDGGGGGRVQAALRRQRTATGTLDWPPMATLGGTIAVYDPIDRRPGRVTAGDRRARAARTGCAIRLRAGRRSCG